uniref:RNA helicase n=1 Tax=Fagus sylvatica TaxID=28930 RepID=A0A2N9EBW3_FAGSY
MVLIGETGSGKSTQLAQYLADSGVAANESVVCTQPRKIAAISLADRVKEESSGCFENKSIICCSAFSSSKKFDYEVIYMTDHCLLQHYMNDNNFSGISCIIIDEAHERSLNTDLLLALIKSLLYRRVDLHVIIMSATADAKQLSEYFFDCGIFHVVGRNFPVDVRYVPCVTEGTSGSAFVAPYVSEVVKKATEVVKTEEDGTILAFLTSQMEVEWACEKFFAPSAVVLPLHGKLSYEEQFRVFQNYPGKRKVIFTTNVAETSLTIPGVKYVIDPGLVKDSKFDPGSGMNVLKVCGISQSSADQRAGRAGRTEPGRCYRLYSEFDYESMPRNHEPEIRRVHLGVAVLRILALGIKNVQEFDFVDAPSAKAIDMAIRNLVQLGAVTQNNDDVLQLSVEGQRLVKLGIEPRLGKLILGCIDHNLQREGVVLAAVMANASSIFCRVGNDEDKQKSDCLKVQFCHHNGDLFTLLSVYKEWEAKSQEERNNWCWHNSINAKSMRRCQDMVKELEVCLQNELHFIIPTLWKWDPCKSTENDELMKKVILSSLAENVAMYSGYDRLGYEVALTGHHVQLHPSSSLLMFSQKPSWVVFGELLSISNQYLVCVTAVDIESLSALDPPPLFDVSKMERRRLQVRVLTGFGSTLLKRFCGKANSNLLGLVSRIRTDCMDEHIGIEVNVDLNEIRLFATSLDMEKVVSSVNDVLEYERKWLLNECMEKCLYHGTGVSPSIALFGAGAEIKHLELDKRYLTVDVYHSNVDVIDDKELIRYFEKFGNICAIHKFTGIGQDSNEKEKWGRITFLTPDAAMKAAELYEDKFNGSLRIVPSQTTLGGDHKMFSFPAVRAKVYWPRRLSKGFAIVKCAAHEVRFMLNDFFNLPIGGKYVRCEAGNKSLDSVVINGIDKEISEAEILEVLRSATSRRILDFFLVRGDAVENPPCSTCEEALLKEISSFMPKRNLHTNCCRVQVFPPEPKDTFMKALIIFDGRLHLEAAKALEQLEGKVLPGCHSWQKIKCQQLFHTSLSCQVSVYNVIQKQLDSLLASFRHLKGAECALDRNFNGSYRVKISANATKIVAELRRPVEELMRGKTIDHGSLTPTILQHLFSRDGINLKKSVQQETGTFILFDRHCHNVRVFGSVDKVALAQKKLIESLLTLHESKQLEIHLRGGVRPPDLMKEVVHKFGPDLHGLKEKVPGAEFTLNTYRHVISVHGNKDLKPKVEEIIQEIAQMRDGLTKRFDNETACAICLCEVDDGYQLEGCGHLFCRLCLVEQCESAIKNHDSFPICCAYEGCRAPILLTDLRSLLLSDKLEELFRASVGAFVALSGGIFRFCPSPDCPSVYRVADSGSAGEPFFCGACYAETCTRCHLEYHPFLSCEMYREYKEDPDSSLKVWCKDKENVKSCPVCGYTIEKGEGCNHVECRCGRHICWVCLEFFGTGDDCYNHLRSVHGGI